MQVELPDSADLIKILKENLPDGMSIAQAAAQVGVVDQLFQQVEDAQQKETAPVLSEGVGKVMNSLWNNKCKTIADVFTTYLRPVNLNIFKVDFNI
jgi:hypothetical protein